jgi:hypothetical protein
MRKIIFLSVPVTGLRRFASFLHLNMPPLSGISVLHIPFTPDGLDSLASVHSELINSEV